MVTIYIVRGRASENWRVALDVYLDDVHVAHLTPGTSADAHGSGRPQQLRVRCMGAIEP